MVVPIRESFHPGDLPKTCHPEAWFWPKDLPECIGLEYFLRAFSRDSWPKSQSSAMKFEASREVLRPKEGLRMTNFEGAIL